MNKNELSRREAMLVIAHIFDALMLAGCAPAVAEAISTPVSAPTLKSEETVVFKAPTEAPSPLPPTLAPEANYFAGGGELDETQKSIVIDFENNPDKYPHMKAWDDGIKGYWSYWSGSKTVEKSWLIEDKIPVVWVFDENDKYNPEKVTAYIDIPYGRGECFSVPLVNGKPQLYPPTKYVNGQNEFGQGPSELTKTGLLPDGTQYFLGAEKANWVRRNKPSGQNGNVIQRLNTEGEFVEVLPYIQTTVEFDLLKPIGDESKFGPIPAFLVDPENPFDASTMLGKVFEFIVEDGVKWGDLLARRVGESSEPNQAYYSKVRQIPGMVPGGHFPVPLLLNTANINKFALDVAGVPYNEKPGTLLTYLSTEDLYKGVYVGLPMEIVKELIKSGGVLVPANPDSTTP